MTLVITTDYDFGVVRDYVNKSFYHLKDHQVEKQPKKDIDKIKHPKPFESSIINNIYYMEPTND